MNRYKFLYLIWLLPATFLALGLHQTFVYYSIQDTYQNGESYSAEMLDFEYKRIAAQTNSNITIQFETDQNQIIKKLLTLPVEMAGDLQGLHIIPIRYKPDSFQEIVLMPAFDTQKSLVWTNMAMAGLALLISLFIAVGVHRFTWKRIKNGPEELEIERID